MTDLWLDQNMEARFTFTSGGAAYTTPSLEFRPDYAILINLTTNAENDLIKAEWFRGMTAAHAFATYRMANDGGSDAISFGRITANGFTLTETAAGVTNSYSAAGAITGATAADPVVITDASHGLSNGDTIRITDVGGMIELNNNSYRVANVTTNTFELQNPETRTNIDGSNFTAYTSGGIWNLLNRVDSNRAIFNPLTYTMTLGTAIVGADSDVMQLIISKAGYNTDLGDIG